MSIPSQRTPLPGLELAELTELGLCCSCQRSLATSLVVDPIDGVTFEVCALCRPVLGGCGGC